MRRRIVYINLHPDYTYSVAVIQGYLDICDYVRNVDWLVWDGRRQLSISGGFSDEERAKERHIQRTKVFAQRMKDNGFTILVRNSRGEEWNDFIFDRISEEEMKSIEKELNRESDKIKWAKEKIEKYRTLLTGDKEKDELILSSIESEEYVIRVENEKEKRRQEIIDSFWNENSEEDGFIEEDVECDELSEEMDEYYEAWLNAVRG